MEVVLVKDKFNKEIGWENLKKKADKEEVALKFLNKLGLNTSYLELYETLNDPKKCQQLLTKLKLKAFW
jgi:hypothetical protein